MAIVPNKDSAEDEILLTAEPLQEAVRETNDKGPRRKHSDKFLWP
jgi:hypothetical protein